MANFKPTFRKLRVFAFDPSLSTSFDTAGVSVVTLKIPWEDRLKPGPVGDYLSVVDLDAAGRPLPGVDLNDPGILHESGLPPSQADRHFHQQMVYGVIMATIRRFEDALGRSVQWSVRRTKVDGRYEETFVRRLAVFANSSEDANAWYDPFTKALYFGYVRPGEGASLETNLAPDGVVHTCLSHDIVVHECTHAIVDGMHRRYLEPSNPDSLAFHEAFADIVAIFQHFTYHEVLVDQIGRARGNLESAHLLLGLAKQLGDVIRPKFGALRKALGEFNEKTGKWRPPDKSAMKTVLEPHARGGILVGAVFDAFVIIYKHRTRDLVRLATGGRGILPKGDLHPDLVARLAREASRAAAHVLNMCIRALDYLPSDDITFGEFLRAIVSADQDLVPDDDLNYRIAFIEAFQRRGIYPRGIDSLAEDSLRWCSPAQILGRPPSQMLGKDALRAIHAEIPYWRRSTDRKELYERGRDLRIRLHGWFAELRDHHRAEVGGEFQQLTGIALDESAPKSIRRDKTGNPLFEVHTASLSRRVGPDGQLLSNLVVAVAQRRQGFFDEADQADADAGERIDQDPDFWFRGGSTLLINLDDGVPQLIIRKDILSDTRLARQRTWMREGS